MAMSDSDKKKIPYIIGLSLALFAYGGYDLLFSEEALYAKEGISMTPVQVHSNQSIDELNLPPSPVSLMATPNSNAMISQPQVFEYVDEKGNPVRAIIEPPPASVSSERALTLTTEDMQIISYARSNLLLELQTKNEELKNAKNLAKNPNDAQSNLSNNVIPRDSRQQFITRPAKDLSGFTEMETIQPAFLSQPMTPEEAEDVFKAVEVASISVGANSPEQVEAFIRVKGKLFKAFSGRRIGDYEIRDVQASHVEIRYIPRNVTQKIGHSGFSE